MQCYGIYQLKARDLAKGINGVVEGSWGLDALAM